MTAILILNWNNYQDTIECLESLLKISDTKFFIVVGDNGSTDSSLNKIEEFLKKENVQYNLINDDYDRIPNIINHHVLLCDLKNNNGFSKGNNLLLGIASQYKPEYYLFLNNDTVVSQTFLSTLISFHQTNPEYVILTPLIKYYDNKNRIWNAGGKLKFGFRRYHYADCEDKSFIKGQFIPCTFITGCALFVSSNILKTEKSIFTERFFFGEEDFEFSMRQNRAGNKMACVCDSIIYHKVSASSKQQSSINKIFIHYLNRFINMRLMFSKITYAFWKSIYVPYILMILSKKYTVSQSKKFISFLLHESKRLDSVDQEYFIQIMSSKDIC